MREDARGRTAAGDRAAGLEHVRLLRLRVAVGVLAVPGQRRGVGSLLAAWHEAAPARLAHDLQHETIARSRTDPDPDLVPAAVAVGREGDAQEAAARAIGRIRVRTGRDDDRR